jgi:hypothetical protein
MKKENPGAEASRARELLYRPSRGAEEVFNKLDANEKIESERSRPRERDAGARAQSQKQRKPGALFRRAEGRVRSGKRTVKRKERE